MERILVTGALGQLGTELLTALHKRYGEENVIATDLRKPSFTDFQGRFEILDVLDGNALGQLVKANKITQIYHLAAVLSANAEKSPQAAWKVNIDGLMNVLELAKEQRLRKVYWPSSIAVFGPDAAKSNTPQNAILNPKTIYGISKVAGEQLCAYYFEKYGLDTRSIRYPGLIGYRSMPGGGTTDYAVEIYFEAVKKDHYTCPLKEDTLLPMMYMDDAVRATLELMEADRDRLSVNTSYNLSGISVCPGDVAASIKKLRPEFSVDYIPDFRDEIAASWPDSIDDSVAQGDWKWKAEYHLDRITAEMISHLKENLVLPVS